MKKGRMKKNKIKIMKRKKFLKKIKIIKRKEILKKEK